MSIASSSLDSTHSTFASGSRGRAASVVRRDTGAAAKTLLTEPLRERKEIAEVSLRRRGGWVTSVGLL